MNDYVFETDDDIIVRTARVGDAPMIAHYFQENRAFLQPWEPLRHDEFFKEYGWSQRLVKLNELHSLSMGFYLLIVSYHDGMMLGTISFSQVTRFPVHSCNVGYSLAQSAQGKGVMTRALKMACHYMFEQQNMHRIAAAYMPRNTRSEAVLTRAGFVQEGKATDYLLINGQWEDHYLTALINPNWSNEHV